MKYLIVGLGNIGTEYENTRHNIGFMIADSLVKQHNSTYTLDRHAFKAEFRYKGRTFIVIKPTTYMNLSGKALKYWADKENIPIENTIVILDDLDLDYGIMRMKKNGSGGSHNGLNNIIETISGTNFPRLRFGIGKNFPKGYQIDYVLGQFNSEEKKTLPQKIETAVEMIESFVFTGIDKTMNTFNNK